MPTVAEQLRLGREAAKLDVNQSPRSPAQGRQIRALEEATTITHGGGLSARLHAHLRPTCSSSTRQNWLAQLDTELRSRKIRRDMPVRRGKKSSSDAVMLLLTRMNWGVVAVIIAIAIIALAAGLSYRAWKNHQTADPAQEAGRAILSAGGTGREILRCQRNAIRRARSGRQSSLALMAFPERSGVTPPAFNIAPARFSRQRLGPCHEQNN